MSKTCNSKAGYSSPCCDVIEENFDAVLCSSENATTENFDDLTNYEW